MEDSDSSVDSAYHGPLDAVADAGDVQADTLEDAFVPSSYDCGDEGLYTVHPLGSWRVCLSFDLQENAPDLSAQALALLNDPFVIDQAKFWAEQLTAAEHITIEERVQVMFQRALGRPPNEEEQQRFVAMIRQLAEDDSTSDAAILQDKSVWQDAAHAIFNMKEVIYIR